MTDSWNKPEQKSFVLTASVSPNFWFGLGLITVGALILLDNFDVIYVRSLWDFWPVILIYIGIAKLFSSEFKELFVPALFIGIGSIFLIENLNFYWLPFDFWELWPLALIIIGLRMIFNYNRNNEANQQYDIDEALRETEAELERLDEQLADSDPAARKRRSSARKNITSDNTLDSLVIFGGKEVLVNAERFKGGNLVTIFGGIDVNFKSSRLAQGTQTLDLLLIFGGAEIYVPDDWRVVTRGVPIFGSFEDTRREVPSIDDDSKDLLVISGLILFGGVEIRSVSDWKATKY